MTGSVTDYTLTEPSGLIFSCEALVLPLTSRKTSRTHHRDEAIGGPALHQVSDVDQDRPRDDGNTDEVT